MIASNLPYRLWLLRYNGKHLRFSQFSASHPLHLPTIISFDLSGVFRPIERADSNGDVHSTIASLAVEQRIKTSPIFTIFSVLSVPSSASPSASPNYNQLRSKRCF